MLSASEEFLAQPSRNFQPPGSIFVCKKVELRMASFSKGTWQHDRGWRDWGEPMSLEGRSCSNVLER